ncbi:M1 family metallopeptidase [Cesiribacter andamanensis]|uniref:Aminopeptidase N n=1 Tax=Cesiribacter andamanensis AMV16 TaxID=1279009 RepID=M7P180_9BACT|nr:M1 family metallopeptidase [Cesiribacter andamanensis]EMR04349.1 Aminopeptidase N [Cesiribacter andamanensis AMV16]
MKLLHLRWLAPLLWLAGCSGTGEQTLNDTSTPTPVQDIHSYARPDEAVVRHLDWEATVDFDTRQITAIARLDIETSGRVKELILDTKDLQIDKVTLDDNETELATFALGANNQHMGSPLRITIRPQTKRVNVHYKTGPGAEALQWLSPEQTAGKQHPFLFTQSQAILARSWVPIQDSPGIRFTYTASVQVPPQLMALMSAENPSQKSESGVYKFRMNQPIPAYLLALAVGDLEFASLGARTGVYAEPSMLKESAWEFAELDKMLEAAEQLYGPYQWERYDLIVLPPSFPFGGMENPRITFATPTILAGDRSLTSLVAHELAHSWSGNLVTNATWNDFWLNEGFTVYFERRIMEALYGRDYAEMLAQLGQQDLRHTVADLTEQGQAADTRLHLNLEGRNPDDGVTDIAYEKGYFLLRSLEERVGRQQWDAFVRRYFSENAFKSMTTERFIDYLTTHLLQPNGLSREAVQLDQWIYEEGLPKAMPTITSERFQRVDAALARWKEGTPASSLDTNQWSSHEWLHFIRNLPQELSRQQLAELDAAFGFTSSGNSELLAAWFMHTIAHGYEPAYPALERFLTNVGRRKFLMPLYRKLAETPEGKERALAIYRRARTNYHFVSSSSIDKVVGYKEVREPGN